MANPFERFRKAGGTGIPTKENAELMRLQEEITTPTQENVNPFREFKQVLAEDAEARREKPFLEQAGGFGMDLLRNFNDALTFGTYSKGLEATGISPGEVERTEAAKRNPAANIVGGVGAGAVQGLGLGGVIGKMIPAMGRNAWTSIAGREAATSGTLSAADDLIREGEIDPIGMGIDAMLGGTFGALVPQVSKTISPSARVRAAGSDVTEPTREQMNEIMARARIAGFPLRVDEALTAANPVEAPPVNALFQDALQTPAGSQRALALEAERAPLIEQAGRNVVDMVGPSADPIAAQGTARQAIGNVYDEALAPAKPLYEAAETRRLPPTWIPRNDPTYQQVKQEIVRNKPLMDDLRKQYNATITPPMAPIPRGGVIPENSVLFQDIVQKRMGEIATEYSGKGQNLMSGITLGARDLVTGTADRVAPTYAPARQISENAAAAKSAAEAGPLGTIMRSPNTATQGEALFGATNRPQYDTAAAAIDQMQKVSPGMPRGILASSLETAHSTSPSTFARNVLPTQQSTNLAERALGSDYDDIIANLNALRAVEPVTAKPLASPPGEMPHTRLFAFINDFGKDRIVQAMNDPKFIERLGREGWMQRDIEAIMTALVQEADVGGRFSDAVNLPQLQLGR